MESTLNDTGQLWLQDNMVRSKFSSYLGEALFCILFEQLCYWDHEDELGGISTSDISNGGLYSNVFGVWEIVLEVAWQRWCSVHQFFLPLTTLWKLIPLKVWVWSRVPLLWAKSLRNPCGRRAFWEGWAWLIVGYNPVFAQHKLCFVWWGGA